MVTVLSLILCGNTDSKADKLRDMAYDGCLFVHKQDCVHTAGGGYGPPFCHHSTLVPTASFGSSGEDT